MDLVSECFTLFVKERLPLYRIGEEFYGNGPYEEEGNNPQYSWNPYLKTEADIQVKFGGFLELYLATKDPGLVVHAELPIYDSNYTRADLTIHRVKCGELWKTKEQVLASCISVIEIKYANVLEPEFDFTDKGVGKDIKLLSGLLPNIKRYLVIVDEAGRIDVSKIENLMQQAKDNNITILSNNPGLMS